MVVHELAHDVGKLQRKTLGKDRADLRNELREQQQRYGEDDRYNAGLVYLDWQIARNATVHFGATHLLCIGNRDLSFAFVDEHNARDDRNGNRHKPDIGRQLARRVCLYDVHDRLRQTADDTREDDQRNAVAHLLLRYQFTEPHHEHGTRHDHHNILEYIEQSKASHDSL